MTFWTENNFEPKRAFRFKLNLGYGNTEESIPYFYLKTATKPILDISSKEHMVGGRVFNFPGIPKWNDVTLEFVDDVDNTVVRKLVNIIQNANYPDMLDGAGSAFTPNDVKFISKAKLANSLTNAFSSQASTNGTQVSFSVEQLNAEGEIVEAWDLYNPTITKFEQDGLDYAKEDLSIYKMTIKYDWAKFRDLAPAGA